MRTPLRTLFVAIAVTGCGAASTTPAPRSIAPVAPLPTPAHGPLAIVAVGDELRGIVPGSPPIWALRHAIAALDGSAVAVAVTTGSTTTVTNYDTVDGSNISRHVLTGSYRLAVVAPAGQWLALTRHNGRRTELMVLDADLGTTTSRTFEVRLEPEAFSTDGTLVFALAYAADGRYRVQTIEVATGERWDTSDRWKLNVPEDMSGVPVRAVMNGDLLSTLYRDPGNAAHPAFVHTLNLADGYSHCADLPPPFGTGFDGDDAITYSADGKTLYVASGGAYATIDVDAVRRRAEGDDDLVPVSIGSAAPIELAAFSPNGAGWAPSGLVSLHDGGLTLGAASTAVDPASRLVAVLK